MSCVPGRRFRMQGVEHLVFAWIIVSRWLSPSEIRSGTHSLFTTRLCVNRIGVGSQRSLLPILKIGGTIGVGTSVVFYLPQRADHDPGLWIACRATVLCVEGPMRLAKPIGCDDLCPVLLA